MADKGGAGAARAGGAGGGPQIETAKYAWPVLFVIFFMSMAIAMTWFAVTAIRSTFTAVYGAATMAGFGRLMQFVSYGAFAGAVIGAPLVEKAGIKATFICAGSCALLGTLVVSLSGSSLEALLAGRVILGLGVGLCATPSQTAIGIWFPLETRGLAMSIWATWVPVGVLIVLNAANPLIGAFAAAAGGAPAQAAGAGFHGLFLVLAAVLAAALLALILVYRAPREGESEAALRARPPLKDCLPRLVKPKLLAVAVTWMVYNVINQCHSSYIITFMQAGYALPQSTASFLGSLVTASSLLAVVFGFISDRLPLEKKYLLIVLASGCLTAAMIFGFKSADISSPPGAALFLAYLCFMFVGNAGLAACVRPYVPILVGKGGVTSIGYAFTGVTLIQYLGQMVAEPFGRLVDALGGQTAAFQSGAVSDPAILAATGRAFGSASWLLAAAGLVGFLFAFALRIKPTDTLS